MALRTTAELIDDAVTGKGAVPAFNVITLEHAEAVVAGAQDAGHGVILQLSQNAVAFHDGAMRPLAAALTELASAASVPIALHLDHVEDADLIHRAAAAGFSSVMVDAGRLLYAENVAQTARETRWLHERGIFVEAELGYVGGKASQVMSAHTAGVRTDPDEAARFVADTGVDALAVAVGSSHAMTSRDAALDFDLIERLASAVPVPLVLHGSSGVADDDLQQAIRAGIRKVNIGTALNVAFTAAVRAELDRSDSVDPRPYLRQARDAMTDTVRTLVAVLAAA
jgi:fructose-bisphosphate aldolase class II